MDLTHLPAHLKTLDVTLGLHVVVGQSVTDRRRFAVRQLERLLVKLRSIGIRLLFLTDEPHQLLSLAARTILLEQLPQHILCIIELLNLNVRLRKQQPCFLKFLAKLRLIVDPATFF